MSRMTLSELRAGIKEYNAYFDALNKTLVGREKVVEALRRALIQRQHVLVFGKPGTAKTKLCDVAFSGIAGSHQFHVELSMFMNDDAVFGPYDVKRMRDEGTLVHRTEGMLPEADLARLGEFLDGSMPLLRSLLGALNERRLSRGRQIIDMPLLTVFCDSNKDPADFMGKNPYAWAVLDRLLFITDLDYLQNEGELAEMVRRFQSGATCSVGKSISLELVHRLSDLVVFPPSLVQDDLLYVKYGQAAFEYRQQRRDRTQRDGWKVIFPDISDRRICLASQMMEVGAVLTGRLEARPEDLLLPGDVLGTTPQERALWKEIAQRKIEEIKEEKAQQLDHAQLVAIASILERAEAVDSSDPKTAAADLKVLAEELDGIAPDNDTVSEKKAQAATKLSEVRSAVREQALMEWDLKEE